MIALIERISVGIPSRIVGIEWIPDASVVIVICAVCGSTSIRARTTFVPRLKGRLRPASRSTGRTARRHTAPSGRSVSAALPSAGCRTGPGPGPAPTTVCPIFDASEHVPAFACGSGHNGTEAIIPESPSGALNDRLEKRC